MLVNDGFDVLLARLFLDGLQVVQYVLFLALLGVEFGLPGVFVAAYFAPAAITVALVMSAMMSVVVIFVNLQV